MNNVKYNHRYKSCSVVVRVNYFVNKRRLLVVPIILHLGYSMQSWKRVLLFIISIRIIIILLKIVCVPCIVDENIKIKSENYHFVFCCFKPSKTPSSISNKSSYFIPTLRGNKIIMLREFTQLFTKLWNSLLKQQNDIKINARKNIKYLVHTLHFWYLPYFIE